MPSRVQPARAVLDAQRYTNRQAAAAIDVEYVHFASAIKGVIRPHQAIRERLPELLGVPLADLFDAERLEKPYCPFFGRSRKKPVDLR